MELESYMKNNLVDKSLSERQMAKMNLETILDYWHSQGHTEVTGQIVSEVVFIPHEKKYLKIYKVVTNLENGMPPKDKKLSPKKMKDFSKIEAIYKNTFTELGVSLDLIRSKRRDAIVCAARRAICKQARNEGVSVMDIALYMECERASVYYHLKG